MSLPAYLYLYDENGTLINGSCMVAGREGSTEIMSSQHGIHLPTDAFTGRISGTRAHDSFVLHKPLDKLSPLLSSAVCENKEFAKAELKYYQTNDAGMESELYRVTMERVIVTSVNFSHAYIPGSKNPNLQEVVGLRYNRIEWFYLPGFIKYDDAWYREQKPAPQTDQQ